MELIGAIFIVLLSLLTIVYGYFKYSFEYWKSRGIPHDEPSIPHGNLRGVEKKFHLGVLTKQWYDKYKSTGAKFCGAYFLARPVAIILDLELVKNILVRDFANFNERGIFYNEKDDPLSAHLFTLDGEKWRQLRTKLTPTFTSGKMKHMFPTIVQVGERFRDCLLELTRRHEEIEMKELFARFTTDIIGTCAFGIECNSLNDPNAEFRHYGRLVFIKPRHRRLVHSFLNEFRNISRALHMKSINEEVSTFFLKVVRDNVEYREKNNINRNDFMDILIKLKNEWKTDKGKAITVEEIAAQAFVFFLAGYETSSTTLSFCLYELAINPEIQSKARRIIQEAYQMNGGQFTYEMMMNMPYIEQLLEETLRKWPPVSNLIRIAQKDYRVPDTDIVIEKGTQIHISAYGIQHDAEYYSDPEKFDPDRFESEEKKKRNPMTWLPFGDGPRNCIGLRFGMMQARVGLVTLLNNFEFSLGSKTPNPLIIDSKAPAISSEGGIYLKLKPIIK